MKGWGRKSSKFKGKGWGVLDLREEGLECFSFESDGEKGLEPGPLSLRVKYLEPELLSL